jgi:hypothetical protein
MGLLNDLWWLSGFVLAAPVAVVGVEYFGRGNTVGAAFFLVVAVLALLLPEYVRWRVFGGGSVLERIPLLGDAEE